MSGLRDALKELRTYCGKEIDDPNASEEVQIAYDDIAINLAQLLKKYPEPSQEEIAKAITDSITYNLPVDAFGGQDERLNQYAAIWGNAGALAVVALLRGESQ